jgi:hypothetical protein
MKYYSKIIPLLIFFLYPISAYSGSLFDDAIERGINETCASYLNQIETSYNLNGLNITFAHPESPSILPSLHVSTQKFNNGSSSFSATLTPDEDYCYISTILTTSVNNQTCNVITSLRLEADKDIKVSTYAEGDFTIITPSNNDYQIILTKSGVNGCNMTETRMIWPGK